MPQAPHHDPLTGEIIDNEIPPNPYALRGLPVLLAQFQRGRYLEEISRAIAKIRNVCNAGLAKEEAVTGTLTLKVTFKSDPAHEMVTITAAHTVSLPTPPKARTAVYIDARGDFSAVHPTQLDLGLRSVPSNKGEPRSATAGGGETRGASAPTTTEVRSAVYPSPTTNSI